MIEPCEFCIIGTGASGGILAFRLAMAGFSVLSLEQGPSITDSYFTNQLHPEQQSDFGITAEVPWDFRPTEDFFYGDAQAHRLYALQTEKSTSAASQQGFTNMQVFRLNGKQNLWNGVSLRYAPRDFQGKDCGDSDANWPISYADLQSHYSAVERLIGVCGTKEGLAELPDGEFLPPLPLRPADLILQAALKKIRDVRIRAVPNRKAIETRPDHPQRCTSCGECIFGCTTGSVYKFSSRLLPLITGRANYRCLCGIKVARLVRNPQTNCIAAAECLDTATGQTLRIEARVFILCCGALETPRVLLNSRDEAFPNGLANREGLVGCFLQENVRAVLGTSLLRLVGVRKRYDPGTADALIIPRFLFDNQAIRGGYMAQYCHFLPKRPYYLQALEGFPGWLKQPIARLLFRSYVALMFFGKPEARRDNRVVASLERDCFGVPQVDVQCTLSDNDRRMQQAMMSYGRRILRKCSGLVILDYPDRTPGLAIHYAGTCRMGTNPTDSVVDANLNVFGHPNLYVCDGSVMTEISEKHPTLTIMALAHRLAEHLLNF